ncbi:helix-turn-helix domain-containing protein [Celeribacter indicus]|uniref:Helix-turn-helix domain-containing protein n=1 Tax=Celeribacter indicus TaxID=1208324 RepID=A0A0B5E6L2_9RHOB|nr:helix-turn-helix domain-containing protein [Celeribacter indicus]AJE47957.1 hypothetical protein P73_3242 [Celeribacter indicus]SDW28005.1 DNA binding domain-containing protein, excisionase family [Celeribacter indicus]
MNTATTTPNTATVVLPALVTQRQAADYLAISEKKLERQRWIGGDDCIPFVKLGRHVRYRAADLLAYVEKNMVASV